MDDVDLLRAWRRDQERRGLAASTVARRIGELHALSMWWGRGLLTLGTEDVQRFLDGRNIGARTRYRWLSFIHLLFRFAIREGLADVDPTDPIQRPRLRRLLPRPAADADLAEAISAGSPEMRAWLALAAYEGFRCMEIAALTRDDVLESWSPRVIIAHGKGTKDRTVPLHPAVLDALERLPMRRKGQLFVSPFTGKPYNATRVSHLISNHFGELGMSWTAHSLRHWFGTKLYEQTGDLRLVQELMGHENVATTGGYVQWARAKATAAVEALSIAGGRLGPDGHVHPHQSAKPPIEAARLVEEAETSSRLVRR